ncbi:MAG TPA: hypothetical protein VN666_21920 [Nitrospira sp.]|nr:hypothetical protein [Nitrospira sp.]
MGSIASGLFDLFSGDPTQKEEQGLQSLSSFENPLGENSVSQGLGFDSDILSGDPTKIAQALAPEIKAGQQQVNEQALTNAQFGNRGGGTNSSTQNAQTNERGNIISLIGGLQKGAADSLTAGGENLLGQGSTNLSKQADLATANRQRQTSDVGGIASGVASIAEPFLGGAPAAGGFQPEQLTNLDMGSAPSTAGLEDFGQPTSPDMSIFDATQ